MFPFIVFLFLLQCCSNRMQNEHGVLLGKGVLLRGLYCQPVGLAPLGSQVNSAQADFCQAAAVCLLLLKGFNLGLSQNHPFSVLLQKAVVMMHFEALNYYQLAPERRNKNWSSRAKKFMLFSVVTVGIHHHYDDVLNICMVSLHIHHQIPSPGMEIKLSPALPCPARVCICASSEVHMINYKPL